jgi:hypothetical protein
MVNTSIANHLKVNNFFSLLDNLEIIPASYLGGSRFKAWPQILAILTKAFHGFTQVVTVFIHHAFRNEKLTYDV